MTKATNPYIRQYLKAVGKELACSPKQKRQFLSRLRTDIEDFADDSDSDIDANLIESHFGKPSEIASNFLSQADYLVIKRQFSYKRVVVLCISIACILTIIGIIGYIVFDNWRKEDFINGHEEVTPIVDVKELPDEVKNPPANTRLY